MANDKNPTEQLRNHMPATHSELNDLPAHGNPANPWEALQARREVGNNSSRPGAHVPDRVYVLTLLGVGAAIITLVILLIC